MHSPYAQIGPNICKRSFIPRCLFRFLWSLNFLYYCICCCTLATKRVQNLTRRNRDRLLWTDFWVLTIMSIRPNWGQARPATSQTRRTTQVVFGLRNFWVISASPMRVAGRTVMLSLRRRVRSSRIGLQGACGQFLDVWRCNMSWQ